MNPRSIRKVVLDTNVVLDWLLYEDPSVASLRAALEAKRVLMMIDALTCAELKRVLSYAKLRLESAQQADILARYEAFGIQAELPDGFGRASLQLPKDFPVCSDRDDQHLLALAFHAKADALLTRDKAVLRLRKRAARFGVMIASPSENIEAREF